MASLDLTEECEIMETMERMMGFGAVMLKSEVTHIPFIKDNHQSEVLRLKANEYFKKKSYILSLEEYTKSLYYAENGSLEEKLAYANRSALLFQRGFYAECLQDIERALKNNYPEEKKIQLIQRREKANSLVSKQTKKLCHGNIPEVETKNPKIPCASEAITFAKNEKYGTFIQATRDIKVGEVLLVEDPYSFVVDVAHLLQYCSACGRKCFNLIPCDKCFALYCSDACKQEAYEQYHEYECVLTRIYSFFNASSGGHVYGCDFIHDGPDVKTPVRMTLRALKDLKGEKHRHSQKGQHHSDCYDEIAHLTAEPADILTGFIAGTLIVQLAHLLAKFTDICNRFDVDYEMLKGLIYKNCCIRAANATKVTIREKKWGAVKYDFHVGPIGAGLYAAFSRFNHACCPNVLRNFHDNTLVVRARRNIKKGDQCFVGYLRQYHGLLDRHVRQTILKQCFGFTCDCKACQGNWSGFPDLCKDPLRYIVWNEAWKASKTDYEILRGLFHQSIVDKRFTQDNRDRMWALVREICEKTDPDEDSPVAFYLDVIQELFLTVEHVTF